jgi:hypothetical protein
VTLKLISSTVRDISLCSITWCESFAMNCLILPRGVELGAFRVSGQLQPSSIPSPTRQTII